MEQVTQSYVALLRAINVGGKHILPMKHLVEMFCDARCVNVRSYIQSGNVVFSAPEKIAKGIPSLLEQQIEKRFGFPAPVILRTRDELAKVARGNPFLKAGAPERELNVYFLAGQPSAAAVKSLDPQRSAPDRFQVIGREIYLHTPNGMGRTKLTSAYFDSKLKTVATARNWATVLKLLEMMG
ncbi:MAG TPA: DUF1697 domain-containing protein [Terriglobales bacterium]|jgi:uncharacterized protein (DUF1697 family)|nr:DUF1697 domain-containing protein [Terriglobales bacterium]